MSQDRTLHVEYRPLDGLIPYARNELTHCEGRIARIASDQSHALWWEAE